MSNQGFQKAKKLTFTMIALFLALSLLLPASSTQALPQKAQPAYSGTYCSSMHSATVENEYISRVQLYDGDQPSGLVNGIGYKDYTSSEFAKIYKGTAYQNIIQVTGTEPSTDEFESRVRVWVDFDQNGIFNDANATEGGEGFDLGSARFTGNHVFSGNLVIPTSVLKIGLTRMRVMLLYGETPTPCSNAEYGETEDYTINVVSLPDLIVTKMIFTPTNIHDATDTFQINVTVRNQGGAPVNTAASGVSSVVRLYIDTAPSPCPNVGTGVYSWDTSDLLPDTEETYPIPYTVGIGQLTSGLHKFYAYADANCVVNEGFETNNSYGPVFGVPGIYLPLIRK